MKEGRILIGKIFGTHGAGGVAKLYSYAESLSVFKPGSFILVESTGGEEKLFKINWVKPHKRAALISLKGVTTRMQADALHGSKLFIEKTQLPELDEDTYYWFDLIGLDVFSIKEKYIGRLENIIETGSNDVYVVKHGDNEILIPAIESVIKAIDLKAKRMDVDLPEGLVD